MTESKTGRMLLSHNFELSENTLPELNREEFAQVFIDGLSKYPQLKCRQLNHPHWMVEILFEHQVFSPPQVGEKCAEALIEKRIIQKNDKDLIVDVLILGGLKKTPPLSDSPDTLQTGEWGIDVVETHSAETFLNILNWEEKTAGKTIDNIFKIEMKNILS
ncbi:MAG: DUF2656 domain-containing protein [Okeania sp. SIO2C9]|uniref:DUF2656 domain-containing protein n=1 Tax=Okeania sp. SIO2C9 TaxID=2607791 RepID=UPI0013BF858D|nr:DUF2656 domain-containing protein [Okeania sp. SIO2C9]NEQ73875.1 DUF2656 domain-containing protein [Okeania sp. SIO2C9]